MDILSAAMIRQFEQYMIGHLRENFPDQTQDVSDEKIRTVIQYGIKKAESFGIEYEYDIQRFMEYMVIYGRELDTKEDTRWLGDILRRDDLDGTAKMDEIDDYDLQLLRESYV